MKISGGKVFWLFFRTIFLGLLGGWGLYIALQFAPFGRWTYIAHPPADATKILGYYYQKVQVQAVDNNIYSCTRADGCVQDIMPPVITNIGGCKPSTPALVLFPFPPGKIVNSLALHCQGVDVVVQIQFVILENGSIWEWFKGVGGFGEENIFLLYGFFGALIGATGSTIVLWAKPEEFAKTEKII